jgi:hypothetical protein
MRILIAVIALCAARAALADGEWTLGAGLNATSGTYGGSTETKIVSIPFTAKYERERWTFKGMVPIVEISGASSVVPGFGRVDAGNRRGHGRADSSAVGLGDSVLAGTYAALAGRSGGLDLTGRIKLATGDTSRGLGTGSNDLGAQLDAWQAIERNTLFGGVGYTVFGDSPIVNFSNVWNATLGASHRLDERDSAGLVFDARQGAAPAPPPLRELTGFWTRKLDRAWRMQAYVLKGFARGSPDFGVGASAAYSY